MYHEVRLKGAKLAPSATTSGGAAVLMGASRRRQLGRWRVERAGSLSSGYGPGWVVSGPSEGLYVPTWQEAMDEATSRARALAHDLGMEATA